MVQRVWKQLRWSLAQRGVWGTVKLMLRRAGPSQASEPLSQHVFDMEFGVDTGGLIGAWQLGGGGPNERFSNAYHGVPPSRLREALLRWQDRLTNDGSRLEDYAFVDIGCGKGRAMMIASEWPFREVMGVELSASLIAVARDNLKHWQELGRAKTPLQLMEGDATLVELPGGPWLIFLYNSFQAPVLRKMLERLEKVAGANRASLYLFYFVPEHEAVFDEFPGFELLWSDVIEMSEEEKLVDHVASPSDRCSLYLR